MEIEVTGARPVPERPERVRGGGGGRGGQGALTIAVVLVVGVAFGYALATARPATRTIVAAPAAPLAPATTDPVPAGLSGEQVGTMLRRVREYNKPESDAVETTPERLMSGRRDNLLRLDDDRTLPAGEYRLQAICLGDGQVWALLRIGDDEAFVDMECVAEHVLVSQLLLTARTGGHRAVTAVTDSPFGVVLGLQILRRG
ncbi:hypothetical protein ABT369_00080 [Dactylosporangium sp. NPDC000244]|uniref:hypothetical protein n=1 Tax=Dactylosporangium sp. NPDC000244 TaxID=3154365 RepID=UPI0033305C78